MNPLDYLKLGWHIFPLAPRTKVPLAHTKGFHDATLDPSKVNAWLSQSPECNWGLSTGPSNLLVVDVDDNDLFDASTWAADLPPTLTCITGGGGRHLYYSLPPQISVPCSTKNHNPIPGCDIRSTGGYVVIPPSTHDTTHKEYWWDVGLDDTIDPSSIVPAPQALIDACLPSMPPSLSPPRIMTSLPMSDLSDIQRALSYIPSDDRDTWLSVGMALKSTDANQAFDLWDEWSKTSRKYKEKDQRKTWRSFKRDGVTKATIFHLARQHGYLDLPQRQDQLPKVDLSRILAKFRSKALPPEETLPPGFVADMAKWILETAPRQQPKFAVAAAISAAANAMGQKVAHESGIRTNLYMVCVGPTGCGKDHPRKAIKNLYRAADIYSEKIGGEEIASGQALMTSAAKRPASLYLLDEFGLLLGSAKDKSIGWQAKSIMSTLLKLFSSADTIVNGKEYANQDKRSGRPREEIEYPCIGLLGTSTPETFFSALSSESVASGFLGRFVVVETKAEPSHTPKTKIPPPPSIVTWCQMATRGPRTQNNLEGVSPATPYIVTATREARSVLDEFAKEMDSRKKTASAHGKMLWVRTWEMAVRLSLVMACAYDPDIPIIKEEHARWAISYVDHYSSALLHAVESRVSDSSHEASVVEILEALKAYGQDGISMRKMARTKPFRGYKRRELNSILEQLGQGGEIEQFDAGAGKRGPASPHIRATAGS